MSPEEYFPSKTKSEIEAILNEKYGIPKPSNCEHGKVYGESYYDPKSKRTYNVHEQSGHRGGKPHVDIRGRNAYDRKIKERKCYLKEKP